MYRPAADLGRRLESLPTAGSDELLDTFLDYVAEKGLSLYPAQEQAVLEILADKNVILNTPTGSGKSLVALAMHAKAIAEGKRSYYSCPIKALVSEKFFALCNEFGPDRVGMLTGDAAVNRDAPIVCCTAEILANMGLREGALADVDYVIMDEFHYYSDRDRGVAWQIPLLTMPQCTYLLMSATLGDTTFFEQALTDLTGRETAVVRSTDRPVPLDFDYRETPLHETVLNLVDKDQTPVYVVCFTQRGCAEEAQNLLSMDYCTREEKRAISAALEGTRFDTPYGKEVQKFAKHGIGLHHAGLLPKYRLMVEKLAQKGHLKIICGTDTLGVGVNIPIRTVLFTRLCKFDGERTAVLSVRDFQQISGRAGRKGFDDQGSVVVQAPEHVIENLRMESKASNDPAKKKKIVRKKPPEKGYAHWDRATFLRLTESPPEPLVSRFQVSHGLLLNVLSRPQGGCRALKKMMRSIHEPPASRRRHSKQAMLLFRSLVHADIVQFYRDEDDKARLRVNVDLQEDFSIHHALALYLIDTIAKLDPESGTYGLDVLTLVESILENPDAILYKQLDRIRAEKVAELKAAGVEYDQRMEELEKLEYPKPNREFVYGTFNQFVAAHPWIRQENIRPKSIAREMVETFQSFNEYVKDYGLERVEGLLLRYLSDCYKALVQTVPATAKNEALEEVIAFVKATVHEVDASLLEEWERMRDPARLSMRPPAENVVSEVRGITADRKAFTVMLRNAMFQVVKTLAAKDFRTIGTLVHGEAPWPMERVAGLMEKFFQEHSFIRTDAEARSPAKLLIREEPLFWHVEQIVTDSDGDNDWILACRVDLERSDRSGAPCILLDDIRS